MFKSKVDRTHKVKYGHRTQLVQSSNLHAPSLTPLEAARIGSDPDWAGDVTTGPSIFYESLWIQLLDYEEIPN
eukprot:10654002-Karenia_brevis.AAC.1